MKLCRKIGIFLLVNVNFCLTMELSLDGRWHSDKITFGEISLGDYGGHPPPITVGNEGVPIVNEIPIKIPHIVPQTVWQPYPVLVPVTKPVPYEVVKYIIKHVVRKVPTPVEKIIPVPVEKRVPFEIERHLAVPIIKRVPFKIPIFKTIVHRSKHGFKKNRH